MLPAKINNLNEDIYLVYLDFYCFVSLTPSLNPPSFLSLILTEGTYVPYTAIVAEYSVM